LSIFNDPANVEKEDLKLKSITQRVDVDQADDESKAIEPMKKSIDFIYKTLGLNSDTKVLITDGKNMDLSANKR